MAKKILVADDDQTWRDYHSKELSKMGYEVLVVENSNAASASLRSDPAIYGAVFDNDMEPGKPGITVFCDIRFGEYGADRESMPILLVFRDVPQSTANLINRNRGKYLDKNKFIDDEYRATVSELFGNPAESPVAVPLGGT